jgi:hypothetical protein
LLIPPVALVAMLVLVVTMSSCIEGDDPDTTAPAPPPGEEYGDVPTGIAGGNELTPVITTCGEAVPAAAADTGERQTVVGDVVNVREVQDASGSVSLLEMGEAGGDVPFAVGIPERYLAAFAFPLTDYVGKELCVNGVVQEYMGAPTVFIAGPGELVETQQ